VADQEDLLAGELGAQVADVAAQVECEVAEPLDIRPRALRAPVSALIEGVNCEALGDEGLGEHREDPAVVTDPVSDHNGSTRRLTG
jgi:hypothetical protein